MGFKCEYKCKPAGHLGFHAVYAWIFFFSDFLVIFSDFSGWFGVRHQVRFTVRLTFFAIVPTRHLISRQPLHQPAQQPQRPSNLPTPSRQQQTTTRVAISPSNQRRVVSQMLLITRTKRPSSTGHSRRRHWQMLQLWTSRMIVVSPLKGNLRL